MVAFWTRLGIQKKIFAGLAVIVILMVAIVVADAAARSADAALSDALISQLLPARAAVRSVKRLIVSADDNGAWYLLASGSSARSGYLRAYRMEAGEIEQWLSSVRGAPQTPQERAALDDFERQWRAYKAGNLRAFALSRRGRMMQSRNAYTIVAYAPVLRALNRYEQVAVQTPIARVQAKRARVRLFADAFAASAGVGAVALAVVVAVRMGGSLRRRLGRVSNAIADVVGADLRRLDQSFRNVAQGDFTAPRYVCEHHKIDDRGSDEVALLAQSYNRLIDGLHELSQRIDESVLDARRRRDAEERLQYLQEYDEITGVPNRHLLHAALEHAIRVHPAGAGPIGVAYLSLLGLDKIQDSFGREFSEGVLKLTAARLSEGLRESDMPARAGYAEFIALLSPLEEPEQAVELTRNLIDAVSRPFKLDGRELLVNASAGLSLYPRHGLDADELLRNATTAMSYAKASGSGEVALYTPRLRSQSLERVTIESDLQRALAGNEFELHYQPIVNVPERRIDAFEALLRWRHPRFGLLEPASFIDVAEDSGTIETLGTWVLQNACVQGEQWHRSGHDVGISVNVSMRQFRGNLYKMVRGALSSSRFPADHLELELTESLMLADRQSAGEALSSLKRLGVRVAIDDFGTGYSSLAYLRTLPLDALKIDRSFVSEIENKAYDEAIARTIILLARTLGVRVIAEGVERVEQAVVLHRLGCREMQGYFFGRPSPAGECLRMLESTESPASN